MLNNQKISGIYQITNKVNGKKYIGQTMQNFTSRWYQHMYYLKNNIHENYKLQEDYNNYGITSFTFEILEVINEKEKLSGIEQKYINQIDFTYDYNLVNSSIADIETYIIEFINYINSKWLVPENASKEIKDKFRIYKEEDKQEIIKKVIQYKLLALANSKITFNRVVDMLENTLGYTIEGGRLVSNKKKYTYKLIVDFDEDKITYKRPATKYDI